MTKMNTPDEPRIELIDPADVLPSDDANPAVREDIDLLMASLKEDGQKVPVLVARHPEIAGKYLNVDGYGRSYCLRILGKPMQAIILDGQISEADRIVLKFTTNALRRSMSLVEIEVDASRFMEITKASQVEAAAKLRVSETTISRALAAKRRIPPELRNDALMLGPHFITQIAPLGDPAKMKDAIAFAKTPTAEGKKPSRQAVTEFVATLRDGKKSGGDKPKRINFTIDGRGYGVELKPDDTPATLIAAFKAVTKRIESNSKKSMEVVIADLVHGDQPAATAAAAKRPVVAEQPALAQP